jgi:hypothetical protein
LRAVVGHHVDERTLVRWAGRVYTVIRDTRQIVFALVALAGCRFDADYDGARLVCPPASPRCPDGYACVEGTCVSGAVDAPPTADASVCELAAAVPDNDGCGDARDLTAAALMPGGTVVHGDTTGYAGDLTPSTLPGCTGVPEPGPDAVYRMTLVAGDDITFTLTPDGWDGDAYFTNGCSGTATCLGGADAFMEQAIAIGTAGTYFLIVDAPASGASGCFTLEAQIVR